MRVLFIHQNFPGQFRYLAAALAKAGHEVRALAISPRLQLPGVTTSTYATTRGNAPGVHPWAVDFETKVIRAEACARKMDELSRAGFAPELVIGHPGWGETWLVKEVWPAARMLLLQEFFYGADLNFDPEFATDGRDMACRFRLKNACLLPGLDAMDWGMSPTGYQRAQFPTLYRDRISIAFEGIDTDRINPRRVDSLSVGTPPVILNRGDEIVTFVNRNLEPYRGYHSFMRALPRLFEQRPKVRVIIVGGDEAGYGGAPERGTTWRQKFFDEVKGGVDPTRIHFLGKVVYETLINLFRITTCHVYLTYPFVLSWSMLEAMSAGALVIGSRTGPVEEAIADGENGLLVDFFDPGALADRVAEVLAAPERFDPLRSAARRTVVDRYALRDCLPRQMAIARAVCEGRAPPD